MLMLDILVISITLAVILFVSEMLWKAKGLEGELARKFVHVLSGSVIAFLPFFISYTWVAILGAGFIVANLVNRYKPIFHAIHSVGRKSWGDLFFGLVVILLALLKPDKWLFVCAVLQVAVADGFAALVGAKAKNGEYKVLGSKKTIVGTLTFLVFSVVITAFVAGVGGYDPGAATVVFVACVLTMLENISGIGTDNITLPLGFLLLTRMLF